MRTRRQFAKRSIDQAPLGTTAAVEVLERRLLLHGAGHPSSAAINLAADAGAGTQLLPDLLPLADAARRYLYGWNVDGGEIPGRALLRLTTAVANVGRGPLELRGGAALPEGKQEVFQRIYESGGGNTERLAGAFTYHPTHGHLHFDDFTQFRLREVVPGDGVGAVVRAGPKISFCLVDTASYDTTLPEAPAESVYIDCGAGKPQGISVGWTDVYNRNLPDQWLDVTGVPAGRYWLEVVADPDDRIVESDETNNAVRIPIDIDPLGSVLHSDRFEPNDSAAAGTSLEVTAAGRSEDFLSLHTEQDEDYYRYTAAFTGRQVVRVSADSGFGAPELYFYGPDQSLLASSATGQPVQLLSAAVTQGQAYTVRVKATPGTVNPTYTISINGPPPMVAVIAADGAAAESGPDAGAFAITRDGPTDLPLTVQYATGGTATNGVDYEPLSGSVIVPPFETSVTVVLRPLDDAVREGDEAVTLSLSADVSYDVAPTRAAANVGLSDDEAPAPLPGPWSTADVGAVGAAGSAETLSDGRFVLRGVGAAAPAPQADAFRIAYQSLTGDGAVVAHLLEWDRGVLGPQAGLVLRESLSPSSRGVALVVGSGNTLSLLLRKASGKRVKPTTVGSAPDSIWLRLSRSGNKLTPATSPDGVSWQSLKPVKFAKAPTAEAGLVAGSSVAGGACAATFGGAEVRAVPNAPTGLVAAPVPGGVDLSWAPRDAGATNLVVERSLKRKKGFVVVSTLGADATTFADTGLQQRRKYYYRVRAVNAGGSSAPAEVVGVAV